MSEPVRREYLLQAVEHNKLDRLLCKPISPLAGDKQELPYWKKQVSRELENNLVFPCEIDILALSYLLQFSDFLRICLDAQFGLFVLKVRTISIRGF